VPNKKTDIFVFCVGVAVLEFLQDGNCGRLLFVFATFFCVCLVVGYAFSCTSLHGSMLEAPSCGCGGMYRLLFSAQESVDSNEQHNAGRGLAWRIRRFSVLFKPTPAVPLSNFGVERPFIKRFNRTDCQGVFLEKYY
jgi:hypothetical protein